MTQPNERLQQLLSDAAEAVELYDEDELERFAAELVEKEETNAE